MSDEFKGHTPGPWKPCREHEDFDGPYFEIDEEDRSYYENRPFTTIMAAGNKSVSSAHDLFEFEEANARLIAAAPDLLAERNQLRARVGELEKAVEAAYREGFDAGYESSQYWGQRSVNEGWEGSLARAVLEGK